MENKIKFQKDQLRSGKEYVWHKQICTGWLEIDIKEKQDIDWQAYRSNKTLKMSTKERFVTNHIAYAFPKTFCGKFLNKEKAAESILKAHKEAYKVLHKKGENNG